MSRKRGTRSLDLTISPGGLYTTTSGIDIGSVLTERDPTASITTQEATGVSKAETKQGKCSVLGSIKLRLTRGHRGEGSAAQRALSVAKSSPEDLPHDPGDRYPTTALTAPTAYALDEVCSRFSDDSSERERRDLKGYRWTGVKGKQRDRGPHDVIATDDSTINDLLTYNAGAININRYGSHSAAATYFPPSLILGKADSHMKRFGDKVRHLLVKGGALLRSLSTRSRITRSRNAPRNEWLEDSLYSGV